MSRMTSWRRLAWSLGTLAWVVASLATSGPLAAHEGPGVLALVAAEPAGPLAVTYRVRLTYRDDGHPATDATVTAVAEGPAGATVPQPMAGEGNDGIYVATVRFPGPGLWTVRFTAVSPPATLERTEQVAAPPTTTTSTGVPTTAARPTTSSPRVAARPEPDGGGGLPTGVTVVVAIGIAAVVAAILARGVRRR